MEPTTIVAAYADGGVVSINPSPIGGTWAYCLIDDQEQIVSSDSGFITPEQIGMETISNNLTEMYAVVKCLEALPPHWPGILHTDSQVTLFRITNGRSFNGLPNDLRLKCLELRRYRKWRGVLVAGHPNRKELREGKSKRGLPVSKWNVWCDEQCSVQARVLLTKEN